MSDDFRRLIEEIEAEAKAEGTEVELCEMRQEFSIVSQAMSLGYEKT
jgi:uncharacterized membrane protein